MSLREKQLRFVAEYLVDLNATQAAIRAGYSATSAHSTGSRMLENAEVREAIETAQRHRADRVGVKADDILRELMRLATVDIGDAFDESGRLRPLREMPEDVRRAIASLDVVEICQTDGESSIGRVQKLRFTDKIRALELLGKHLKMWTDKVEHTGQLTLEQLVTASMAGPEQESR